ncbi:methylated-DNA--[protein]-cysteine S-methyltransferase [Primorskyibacter sp. 2E107]|uniref:methylated-DNA--[protein]-cysteine S-methyltransferase n=1 Tax=Primorskyibacter sp. 2E107 TaxID=3403458 RepID=UPI003AF7A66D
MPERAFDTPFGRMTVVAENDAIIRVMWRDGARDKTPVLLEAEAQIAAYSAHRLLAFELPMHIKASPFQQRVCEAMQAIPLGETRQYGDLAGDLGVSAQAIGQACGGNPIPILIPCHRVLAATGLGGFSGGTGIETKVQLLRHEGAASLLI